MNSGRRLYKSNQNKVFFGVCGGIGEYFNIDPVLVRLGFAVLCCLWFTGIVVYLVAAMIIPQPYVAGTGPNYTQNNGNYTQNGGNYTQDGASYAQNNASGAGAQNAYNNQSGQNAQNSQNSQNPQHAQNAQNGQFDAARAYENAYGSQGNPNQVNSNQNNNPQ